MEMGRRRALVLTACGLAALVAACWLFWSSFHTGPSSQRTSTPAPAPVSVAATPAEVEASSPPREAVPPAQPPVQPQHELWARGTVVREVTGVGQSAPGQPCAGLPLTVRFEPSSASPISVATDSKAAFSVSIPDPGQRPIRVTVDVAADAEYQALSRTEVISSPERFDADFTLTRLLKDSIAGRVVDDLGDPLPGVHVQCVHHTGGPCGLLSQSDDSGRFSLARHADAQLEYVLPGWAVLSEVHMRRGGTDAAPELLVTLIRAGQLIVHVLDNARAPIKNAQITCTLFGPDPGVGNGGVRVAQHPHRFGSGAAAVHTDGTGTAIIDDCWLGRQLVLRLNVNGQSFRSTSLSGSTVTWQPDLGEGDLVLVRPGQEITATIGQRLRIYGQVLAQDGSKASRCFLQLSGRTGGVLVPSSQAFPTLSKEGAFDFSLPLTPGVAEWTLQASTSNPHLSFAGGAPDHLAASRRLELDQAHDGALHVDLRLAAGGSISGHVAGSEKDSFIDVSAYPAGTTDARGRTFHPDATCTADSQGSFVLRDLEGATYDLVVSQECSMQRRSTVFRNIRTGTEGLELTLGPSYEVELVVSAVVPQSDSQIARMQVLIAWPMAQVDAGAEHPAGSSVLDSMIWPSSVPIQPGSPTNGWLAGDFQVAGQQFRYSTINCLGGVCSLPPQTTGPLAICVAPFDAEGKSYIPASTGLRSWSPGRHDVSLTVSRSTPTRVTVEMPAGLVGRLQVISQTGEAVSFSLDGISLIDRATVWAGERILISSVPPGSYVGRISITPAQPGSKACDSPLAFGKGNSELQVVRYR